MKAFLTTVCAAALASSVCAAPVQLTAYPHDLYGRPQAPVFLIPVSSAGLISGSLAAITAYPRDLYGRAQQPAFGVLVNADGSAYSAGGGSGTVTSITAGTNLTGGTITTSGTIGLGADVPLLDGTNAWTGTNNFTNGPVVPGIFSPGNAVIINLNQFGEGIDGFANIQVSLTGGAPGAAFAIGAFGTITNSAGVAVVQSTPFTVNQTGAAGTVVYDCDPTLTAVGTGVQHCFSVNPGDTGELAWTDLAGNTKAVTVQTDGFRVSTLPTCNTASKGVRTYVTDAISPVFLTALTGGGSSFAPTICNGTSWIGG